MHRSLNKFSKNSYFLNKCMETSNIVNSFDGWRFRPGVSSKIDSHQAWVPGQLDFVVTTWPPELGNWLGWSWFTSHHCLFRVSPPCRTAWTTCPKSRCQFNSQDYLAAVCPGAYPIKCVEYFLFVLHTGWDFSLRLFWGGCTAGSAAWISPSHSVIPSDNRPERQEGPGRRAGGKRRA